MSDKYLNPDIPAPERRGIAPHRGDVTTVQAANRLNTRAVGTPTTVQQQQPPVTAREAPQNRRPGQVLL